MGRHSDRDADPADLGSRRAIFLTLLVSVLLLAAGVAILRMAGDAHLGPGGPATPSPTMSATTTS